MTGALLASVDLPVERGKIRELAAAFAGVDPGYLAGDRLVAPPTFAMCAAAWPHTPAPDAPQVALGANTLHAEQEFEYLVPVVAGDSLYGTETLRAVRDFGDGSRLVTFETEFRNQHDVVALISRTTVWDVTDRATS